MPCACPLLSAVAHLLTWGFFAPHLCTEIRSKPRFARMSFHVTLNNLFLFTYKLALGSLFCYWDLFTQHRDVPARMMLSTIISKGFNSLSTALHFVLKTSCSDRCLNDTESVKPFFSLSFDIQTNKKKSCLKPVKVYSTFSTSTVGPGLKSSVAKLGGWEAPQGSIGAYRQCCSKTALVHEVFTQFVYLM